MGSPKSKNLAFGRNRPTGCAFKELQRAFIIATALLLVVAKSKILSA